MRRVARVVLGLGLLVTTASPATAQTFEPGQAVGAGGRVEVQEAGYAVTLPDGWLHIRPTLGDVDAIVEQVRETVPELTSVVQGALGAGLGLSLIAYSSDVDPAFTENCNVLDRASTGETVDAIAANEIAKMSAFGDLIVGGPQLTYLELPSGRAARIDVSLHLPAFETLSTSYLMTDGTQVHTLTCTDLERPPDAWLSIAQTFEMLPTP